MNCCWRVRDAIVSAKPHTLDACEESSGALKYSCGQLNVNVVSVALVILL